MLVANVKWFKNKHTMELKHFSEMMQLVLPYSKFDEIMTGQLTIMVHANSSSGPGPDRGVNRITANLQVYQIIQSNSWTSWLCDGRS